MNDAIYYPALQDAADLIRGLRMEAANGPKQIWLFLNRVHEYISKQRDAAYQVLWEEVKQ